LSEKAFRRTRMPNRRQLTARRHSYCQTLIGHRHARSGAAAAATIKSNSSDSGDSVANGSDESIGGSKSSERLSTSPASSPEATNRSAHEHHNQASDQSNNPFRRRRNNSASLSPPTSPSGWLRKSVQDLFRLSSTSPPSISSSSIDSAPIDCMSKSNGRRPLVVSADHSKIALLQRDSDHSRIEVRDIRYCSIFYPNRRPSIVLSDSEQHAASVCRLDAHFDARLWLVGVSSDAGQLLLCEPEAAAYACTAFMDQGVRVWLFEVPGQVQFAFFNALDWTLLTVDPVGRVTKLPLKAVQQSPDHQVQQSEAFLLPSNATRCDQTVTGGLQMASLDSDYRLLWLYSTIELNPPSTKSNDMNSIRIDAKTGDRLTLSMATVALQTSAPERFGRLWMRRLARLTRKSGSIAEEQIDLCPIDIDADQSNANQFDHDSRRKSSGIELSGSDLDDESSVNSRRSTTDDGVDRRHDAYTSTTDTGSESDSCSDAPNRSAGRESLSGADHGVHKSTVKPTNGGRRVQRVLVLDTVNLRVFRELRLNAAVQIVQLVTAGGMAYCAHADGSVSMLASGSDEESGWPQNARKSLLQAQPDEKLIHLQVFDVSCPASLKSLVGEQLAECLKRRQSDSQRSGSSGECGDRHSCSDSTAESTATDVSSLTGDDPNEMIPPLPARLSHVRNSDILVVALYRSGKLHCIYTKNGCVQERKLTRLDVSGPEGLLIERLNIVSALKMDWKEEEEEEEEKIDPNPGKKFTTSRGRLETSNGTDAESDVFVDTRITLKARSGSLLKRSVSHKLDSEVIGARSMVRRSSLSPNQCSYLVTLCSPSPNYRLINVKL
jgi:Tfp pilus assembly protein PilV